MGGVLFRVGCEWVGGFFWLKFVGGNGELVVRRDVWWMRIRLG